MTAQAAHGLIPACSAALSRQACAPLSCANRQAAITGAALARRLHRTKARPPSDFGGKGSKPASPTRETGANPAWRQPGPLAQRSPVTPRRHGAIAALRTATAHHSPVPSLVARPCPRTLSQARGQQRPPDKARTIADRGCRTGDRARARPEKVDHLAHRPANDRPPSPRTAGLGGRVPGPPSPADRHKSHQHKKGPPHSGRP